jgi:DNA-binding CsgD family transcriptional regulator
MRHREVDAMTTNDALQQGRDAFDRAAWLDAFDHFVTADRDTALGYHDLGSLAIAAYLLGRDDEADAALARAHQDALRTGDLAGAARFAFWLGFGLADRGEHARANGWLARAERLLVDHGQDCVERGYVLLPAALRALDEGDASTACDTFSRATEIAARFADPDLAALGRLGTGTALIQLDEIERGVGMMDEAMVAVTLGEVSSIVVGIVYCSAIETFLGIYDHRRAQEWTEALALWCTTQPEVVPYRGSCLLYRAELMHLHGAWRDADQEVRRARDALPPPAAGNALYLEAELHRIRGEFPLAEDGYRQAADLGRTPEPGLAQLLMNQGRTTAALAAIRRAMDETHDRGRRASLLGPCVEIALAAGEVAVARRAADELTRIAQDLRGRALRAMAERAAGAVLLAEGDTRAAITTLRHAWTCWRELDAPYEAARTRVLISQACAALGDDAAAAREVDGAARVFRELGALPDLAMIDALTGRAVQHHAPGGALTTRELEILRLLAAGKTNRMIAADLVISQKTVARHVSNIFSKLGISSRSAATAYAYEHGLVRASA